MTLIKSCNCLNIKYCGEISDVTPILKNYDVYSLISNWEGLPIGIIEGIRAGLPIVVSNVGGCSEMIENNGYYIKRKDSKEDQNKKYTKLLTGDYWKLSDFDFDILWKQAIEEVKLGQVEFSEHVKLFAIFKYLISIELINYPISELKQNFILGMQLSAADNLEKIESNNNKFTDIDTNYDTDDRDIWEIKEEYLESHFCSPKLKDIY